LPAGVFIIPAVYLSSRTLFFLPERPVKNPEALFVFPDGHLASRAVIQLPGRLSFFLKRHPDD
jgi:hypothetical protein